MCKVRIHVTHRLLFAILACAAIAAPVLADDPDNCLLCHQFRGLGRHDTEVDRVHLYFVDPDYGHHRKGPHARLACTDCHEHSEVSVIPHQPVTPVDCARQCHLSDPTGLERQFSHDNVQGMLELGVHTTETLSKLQFAEGPLLREGQSICLYCHDEPLFRDPSRAIPQFRELSDRVFDRCDVCHTEKVSADIEYYVRHIASRFQPARSPLELAQVCSVCHSDPQILQDYELKESVASFVRSFHGKAALLGDETTADCLSCHVKSGENAHLMLGSLDPLSSVHETNVADSCIKCHPGAGEKIAEAAVHLDLPTAHGTLEFTIALLFIVITVLTFGPSALLVVLDLLQVVVGREHAGDEWTRKLAHEVIKHPQGRRRLIRFTIKQRIEHWLLSIMFMTLVVTGFPMKFADHAWAAAIIRVFGGLQIARHVHHWAGIALIVGFTVHLIDVFISLRRRAREVESVSKGKSLVKAWVSLPMWISPTDVRKTFQLLAYYLFLRKDRPSFGRFSPTEKFEYLGVFWGTVLLGVTGALLWGEEISSRFLSGRAFNIATIAHTYEAFLAVIHVGILHIYNVILAPKVFPLSTATLNGHTPIDKLAEEHGELVEQTAQELGISSERNES